MESEKFYCYSPKLKKELFNIGVSYVSCGKHKITKKIFWVYELNDSLKEYLDKRKASEI